MPNLIWIFEVQNCVHIRRYSRTFTRYTIIKNNRLKYGVLDSSIRLTRFSTSAILENRGLTLSLNHSSCCRRLSIVLCSMCGRRLYKLTGHRPTIECCVWTAWYLVEVAPHTGFLRFQDSDTFSRFRHDCLSKCRRRGTAISKVSERRQRGRERGEGEREIHAPLS